MFLPSKKGEAVRRRRRRLFFYNNSNVAPGGLSAGHSLYMYSVAYTHTPLATLILSHQVYISFIPSSIFLFLLYSSSSASFCVLLLCMYVVTKMGTRLAPELRFYNTLTRKYQRWEMADWDHRRENVVASNSDPIAAHAKSIGLFESGNLKKYSASLPPAVLTYLYLLLLR